MSVFWSKENTADLVELQRNDAPEQYCYKYFGKALENQKEDTWNLYSQAVVEYQDVFGKDLAVKYCMVFGKDCLNREIDYIDYCVITKILQIWSVKMVLFKLFLCNIRIFILGGVPLLSLLHRG